MCFHCVSMYKLDYFVITESSNSDDGNETLLSKIKKKKKVGSIIL